MSFSLNKINTPNNIRTFDITLSGGINVTAKIMASINNGIWSLQFPNITTGGTGQSIVSGIIPDYITFAEHPVNYFCHIYLNGVRKDGVIGLGPGVCNIVILDGTAFPNGLPVIIVSTMVSFFSNN